MRTGTCFKVAVAAALTVATAAVTPAAVAAPGATTRPARIAAGPTAQAPAWHTASAGELSDSAVLFDIASVTANAAWAVGLEASRGVVLHWDGRVWQRQSTRGVPETGVWHALDAASAHDVWAYGWSQTRETLAHYDGKRWTDTPLPQLPDGGIYGFAKLAAAPGRIWLADDTGISSYAGGTWQRTPLPSGVFINALEARTSHDAWAVGQFALAGRPSRAVALHWDGRTWTDLAPAGGLGLAGIYQESARSVWATALTPYSEDEPQQTKVLHWDGATWHDVTGPVTGLYAPTITGDARGTVWISGDPYGYEGPALYWRHRDNAWTLVAGDTVPTGHTQSYTVQALAPIGRTGRFWSVGSYEVITGEATSAQYELIQRSTR